MTQTPPPEVNLPKSPADRRPSDRPFYISPNCPKCNTPLVYEDWAHGETDWDEVFFDEFMCPKCKDGAYLDWTPSQIEKLEAAVQDCLDGKSIPYTVAMAKIAEYLTADVELDEEE